MGWRSEIDLIVGQINFRNVLQLTCTILARQTSVLYVFINNKAHMRWSGFVLLLKLPFCQKSAITLIETPKFEWSSWSLTRSVRSMRQTRQWNNTLDCILIFWWFVRQDINGHKASTHQRHNFFHFESSTPILAMHLNYGFRMFITT